MPRRPRPADPRRETERWFLAHGLSYFVPAERAAARAALRPRHLVPVGLLVVVVTAALGGALGWVSQTVSAAPAVWLTLLVLAVLWYASTALHARPILTFALRRTVTSVPLLVGTAMRALPLLLLFVAFLFINAEAWEMSASLPFTTHWLVVLLLLGVGVVFQLIRLPEEVDKADDAVDEAFLERACRGTPMESTQARLAADPGVDAASYARVTGFERWNLIIALLLIQLVQVVALIVAVFVFLLVFGSIIMQQQTQLNWTGLEQTRHVPYLGSVSVELVKVSLFLASFSGLYFIVSAVTDDTYRHQFFSVVTDELERAVGVRAVYRALRARERSDSHGDGDGVEGPS
ncbi:hypothetical protein AVL62_02730 [Serinicoccus chungangensis]|uniref:Integral membrane protein n=1 Tax=Serinicoccus chungangensis TaxID=767452 RepID=A0A0W8I605_9MICO|nr:hypothetical protein [Serinicoccus chungangensis]KUG53699.1 hypothetical protein AVL62_02730 [Serinicoccus chungangensis]